MASTKELAFKYSRKFKTTLFDSGIGAKLPDAYRKFFDEWRNTPPEAVNYIPYTGKTWVKDEKTGEVKRYENVPLPEKFPKELQNVFTGGEAVIQGFKKKKKYACRVPRFWVPIVYRSVIYSEILNKYLSVLLTKRVIELIHKHRGFDNYLLQTKACDLKTLVALKVKQRLLLALDTKDLPYDEEKNNVILKKYEKFLIPLHSGMVSLIWIMNYFWVSTVYKSVIYSKILNKYLSVLMTKRVIELIHKHQGFDNYLLQREEIEWYGLSFTEACKKQKEIEEANKKASVIPLKQVFRAQLLEELNNSQSNPPEGSDIKKSIQQVLHIDKFIKKT